MILNEKDIQDFDKRYRSNLINSITGIKPANLIGTQSNIKEDNLAIFSSIVHLGSNPAHIGMVSRPQTHGMKDTFANIMETGFYTINHISASFIKKAHYTSARLDKNQSEFDVMNLQREFIEDFSAPFVAESPVKIGMKHLKNLDLPNGCIFIIGKVVLIQLPDFSLSEEGQLKMDAYDAVGINGLDSYYSLKKIRSFPYAKKDELPNFSE